MRRGALVLASLLTAACATAAPPHPPIGMMWATLGTPENSPTLEMLAYAPDRPSCEYSRAMAQTRSGVPVPTQRSAPCQQVAVLPYREGAESVYWVFSAENDAGQFAAGGNDRSFCTNFRQEALKALRPDAIVSECEPVIVKRVM